MWKKLLELMSNEETDEAVQAIKLFQSDDFEMSVEMNTAMMDTYDAAKVRARFSRIADTVAGHHGGRERAAWANVAFNLDPTSGNATVQRSFNR
jgi:malate/lactate dehydrogenase